ncbi:MAG TPA: hypothetical protein VFO73_14085 [Candidatus Limnocylindrales bacterium]|nr:hypothetical protein [Candidatus Limnocylindrales bacterium]
MFLLGAAATSLVVWHVSGLQYGLQRRELDDLASLALGTAPFLTVLVALGLGWVEPRPALALALLGLTLVGPGLILAHLTVSPHVLQGPGGLIATPACTAAAAGIVSAHHGQPGRGTLLLVCGGVVGFLAVALPMWALQIGNVADCPVGCNSLEMRGLSGTATIVGVIGLVAMAPGLAVGWFVGRRAAHEVPQTVDPPR